MFNRLSEEIHRLVAEEPLVSASSSLKESPIDSKLETSQGTRDSMKESIVEVDEITRQPEIKETIIDGEIPRHLSLSVDEAALHEVVRRAISEAMEAHASGDAAKRTQQSVNSSADSVEAPSTHGRMSDLASRMDMLEGLLINGLQSNERRERDADWNDTESRFAALEQRLEALEYRLEELAADRDREVTVIQNGREVELTSLVMELTSRLSELEQAVGTEHEFSLKLLDLLLNQQQHPSSQSLSSSKGGSGNGTLTTSSDLGGRKKTSSSVRSKS